ncbi:MAG: 5-methylcytosine-specific restriction endonuclease system specificity protein McrC [Bacillota bacterium]|nr:5-methylcytosine-specific restriction endonuclease system specificity protein McrC [Bacillota bacterium]
MDGEAAGGGVMIRISNVYHMLAYAFRSLNVGGSTQMGKEEFKNLHELFAEIIMNGMRKQLKRGLPHCYSIKSEELGNLRGKIDLQSTIRGLTMTRRHLVCAIDDFTEDTPGNRLIKYAIAHLLRQNDVSTDRKHYLKFLWSGLNNVTDTGYIKIPPQRTGGAEYIFLVNICHFLLDGMLMKTGSGYKMQQWLKDETMSSLYEHFLLEYFRRHHACFNARSARIDWDMPVLPPYMPQMRSDVFLTYGDKKLIIDAKFYNRTMSEHFGKKIYHSHNLYQIFTYVKNEDKTKDGSVSGMLLYAKTDEDITPDSDSMIGGNMISVKTLDLSQNFASIRSQLDQVASILV